MKGYLCAASEHPRLPVPRPTATAVTAQPSLLRDAAALFKLRLASLVVFSAGLGYWMGSPVGELDAAGLLVLLLAGTLVTGSSNAFNQVWELNTDALMQRTAERPLVRGSMSVTTALVLATIAGIAGLWMLWAAFGVLTAILGLLSHFMYCADSVFGVVTCVSCPTFDLDIETACAFALDLQFIAMRGGRLNHQHLFAQTRFTFNPLTRTRAADFFITGT